MIVDQAIYREGHRLVCQDLSEELDRLREEGNGFLWIGLKDPTDAEFALVNQELELHPLAVEDAVRGDQRAKIEHYEGSLLVVLKTLRYVEDTSDVETGEVMVFLGDRFVVTVRRGDANPLAGVRARLEQNAEHLSLGPAAVLHAVMDSVVDNYILVDNEIHEDLEHIEQLVFSGTRGVDATVIYRLKREVLEIRRASQPLAEAMERLFVQPHRAIVDRDGSDVLAFFRDVKDHLLKVNDHVESYDRLLSDILSAHLAQISVGQNDDMRKISAWIAIAAVPTMIAGIYGMNFDTIPELTASISVGDSEYYYGYFVVLALMAVVCFGLYRAFKRSGWL
jgi:magnesium transporter